MRVIGLLGGMSWESTVEYYRIINQEIRRRLGRQHSARILLYSVDFEPIERLNSAGEWAESGRVLAEEAKRLERGGADFILLCSNTMHKVVPQIEASISIPLVHIVDATAERVHETRLVRVGLLGTRFTMGEEFYRLRLNDRYGLEVLVPEERDRALVDRVIFEELCKGKVLDRSRGEFVRIIDDLIERGAEGIILGCTELGLLISEEDSAVPVFDTARIHAERGVEWALAFDDSPSGSPPPDD